MELWISPIMRWFRLLFFFFHFLLSWIHSFSHWSILYDTHLYALAMENSFFSRRKNFFSTRRSFFACGIVFFFRPWFTNSRCLQTKRVGLFFFTWLRIEGISIYVPIWYADFSYVSLGGFWLSNRFWIYFSSTDVHFTLPWRMNSIQLISSSAQNNTLKLIQCKHYIFEAEIPFFSSMRGFFLAFLLSQ